VTLAARVHIDQRCGAGVSSEAVVRNRSATSSPWAGGWPDDRLHWSSPRGTVRVLSVHLIVAHRPAAVDFKHTQAVAIATRIVR